MMTQKTLSTLAMSCLMVGLCVHIAMAQYAVRRMTPEELNARLDDPDVVVVDVRLGRDWYGSDVKIKGAMRVEPRAAAVLADTYDQDTTLVFYCA